MFLYVWDTLLFTPLVNLLIFLYNEYAFQSYALAVAELVIIIRLVLLPLSIIEERNQIRYRSLDEEIDKIAKYHLDDPVKQRELIREVLRRNKIKPWVKLLSFGVQAMILLLLYLVNTTALNNLDRLYFFIDPPIGLVNTVFMGKFDVLKRYYPLAAVCAFYLFIKIVVKQAESDVRLTESERKYRYVFPLFTFVVLSIVPATKSIFILTTMLFSTVVHRLELLTLFMKNRKDKKQPSVVEEDLSQNFSGDPWERFKKN